MSKKKANGSTMTLKDFHGGSIPSDLPLPSAPGVIVRPSDRPGYDRQSSWGNPIGRPDYRSRPNSSPATRNYDDKTPFLTHTSHIGRNFDEDERKPLDGGLGSSRTVSDESLRPRSTRMEKKPDLVSTGRLSGRQGLTPVSSQFSSAAPSSYSARVAEGTHVGMNSQNVGVNTNHAVSGSYPNAWGMRKEVAVVNEPMQSAWSESVAVSKLAHASALDKVSSGRWQTKLSVTQQPDVEVIHYPETESSLHLKAGSSHTDNEMDVVVKEREYYNAPLVKHVERGLNVDDGVHGGGKEFQGYDRVRSPGYLGIKERNFTLYGNGVPSSRTDGMSSGSEVQLPVPSETSERPKLKLFPRSKPLESSEPPVIEYKQVYQRQTDYDHADNVTEVYRNVSPEKPESDGSENGNRAVERPKLNLKPRSQPLQQLEVHVERGRSTLFGGARPRELVLKERGVNDVVDNHDLIQSPNRVKHDSLKTAAVSGAPKTAALSGQAPGRHIEKTENLVLDHKIGKNTEKKDHRAEAERGDMQRRNWRNDNWKNNREMERPQQQERQRSPETWRKPAEQQDLGSRDAPGVRHGKATSAVELAQAFSRSMSDPKMTDKLSGQKGIPSRTQMPFSRLTAPTPRPQINGY